MDPTFNAGANGIVYSVLTEPNGEILIGGAFTTVNGVSRNGVAKLYPDGTLDTNFANLLYTGGTIYSMLLQPDGRLLIGGNFNTSQSGSAHLNVARLNLDGSIDNTFTNATPSGAVYAWRSRPTARY